MDFIPYAQKKGHLPDNEELAILLANATWVLSQLVGVSSCHKAVKVWSELINIGTPVRGFFHPNFEHSWIDMGRYTIDIYPVGGCRPHFVSKEVAQWLYKPEESKSPKEYCSVCGRTGVSTDYLPIYTRGSEGTNVCHQCKMEITELTRSLERTAQRGKIEYVMGQKRRIKK